MIATRFEGAPCKLGHTTRYVSSRECVACVRSHRKAYEARFPERNRLRARTYYAANPEKWRAYARKWANANPEKIRASSLNRPKPDPIKNAERARTWYENNKARANATRAAYRKAHPEKRLPGDRRYALAHPEQRRARVSKWRALKRNAPGSGVSSSQWQRILSDSLGLCAYCNTRAKLTIDHIEPLALGGAHDVTNIAAVCKRCNSSKCDTPLVLWLAAKIAA